MDIDQKHVDQLYSAPRESFVAARNALAKQLKESGETETAAAVARLRKPTLAAWALNQVARTEGDQVRKLLAAQQEMQEASSADALRKAGERRQELIARLTQQAADLLDEGGHGGQAGRDKIQLTLLALGTNPQAAEAFRLGHLTDDVEPTSSWDVALAQTGAERPARRQSARATKELKSLIEKAEQLEKQAEQAARRLEEAKQTAKTTAASARKARQAADRQAAAIEDAD